LYESSSSGEGNGSTGLGKGNSVGKARGLLGLGKLLSAEADEEDFVTE
jgi:hypothetical protein